MNMVTGAFGFTGKYIAQRLLSMGEKVSTLTGHPGSQNPFGRRVNAFPFNFDDPDKLAGSLEGTSTFIIRTGSVSPGGGSHSTGPLRTRKRLSKPPKRPVSAGSCT